MSIVDDTDPPHLDLRQDGPRVREILRLGEAIVPDNAARLTSCLVLATGGDDRSGDR
jgi:hypothetical protein